VSARAYEMMWELEQRRALAAARAEYAPSPPSAPQPGDPQQPGESPEDLFKRTGEADGDR